MGVLELSVKERKRLELLGRVRQGALRLVKATEWCWDWFGVSYPAPATTAVCAA